MPRVTLQECRDTLYNAVVPSLSGTTDGVPNQDIFDQTLNLALEEIVNSGSWLGLNEHVAFLVPEGDHHITLPPEYASVEAMAYERQGENGCVSRIPVQIRNQWMVVLSPGPFLWNQSIWNQYGFYQFNAYANDGGDGVCTFRDSPFPIYTLKFELESEEDEGKTVLVKGYNEDGDRIFTPSSSSAYEGIEFEMSYPDLNPPQMFSKQIYFLHKEPWQGYLKLYAVNSLNPAEEYLIGTYQPNQVNPDMKRYGIPNCSCQQSFVVRTICKRRFVPVFHGTDTVFPGNLRALRLALTAMVYERQNDPGRRDTEMAKCIEMLNAEVRSFRGGAALRMRIDSTAFGFQGLWPGR